MTGPNIKLRAISRSLLHVSGYRQLWALLLNFPSIVYLSPKVPIHHLSVDSKSDGALFLEFRFLRDSLLLPSLPSEIPPPSPFRVSSPHWRLCQGLPRQQWSQTFRSPPQGGQTTSCLEITQTDPHLNLCSEFTVSKKHLQFCSFANRLITCHWLGSPLQLLEADKGLIHLESHMGSPTGRGSKGRGCLHLFPLVVRVSVAQKCISSFSP